MTDKELDDLEARLRGTYAMGADKANPEFGFREFPTMPICKEAANAIAELREKNAGLEKALKALESAVADYTDAETQTVIFSAAERRKALKEDTQ